MEDHEYETVLQSIDEHSPNLSQKEKKKLAEVIVNISRGISVKDSLGVDSDAMEQLYAYGHKLFSTQKYEDAAKMFQTLYLLDPMDARYALAIGASFQMAKKYDSAIGWYLALSLIDEDTPLAFYYISDCFLKLEHPIASHEFLNKTIERCGDNPHYTSLKTRAGLMMGSLEKQMAEEGAPK